MKRPKLGVVLGNGPAFLTVDVIDVGEIRVPVDGIEIDGGRTHVTLMRELPVRLDEGLSKQWREIWLDSPWKKKLKAEPEEPVP